MRNLLIPAALALPVGACSTLPTPGNRLDMTLALALVRHQATTESYMTANAFSYQVYAAGDSTHPIPVSRLRHEAGPRVVFVGEVSDAQARQLDLARMTILAPVPRSDGDHDVVFSYNTCLHGGGYYGWDSRAVMRLDSTGWHVVSVAWTGHSRGMCNHES